MHAPPKLDYPVATPDVLKEHDAFLWGIPTRYGNFPAQWKSFIDSTGGLWQSGALNGKYCGLFVSTAGLGGGQETTCVSAIGTLVHHGMIYVPLGYANVFKQLTNLDEVHGSSPWGAGTFAVSHIANKLISQEAFKILIYLSLQGGDGSRMASDLEKEIAHMQGKFFYQTVSRVNFD